VSTLQKESGRYVTNPEGVFYVKDDGSERMQDSIEHCEGMAAEWEAVALIMRDWLDERGQAMRDPVIAKGTRLRFGDVIRNGCTTPYPDGEGGGNPHHLGVFIRRKRIQSREHMELTDTRGEIWHIPVVSKGPNGQGFEHEIAGRWPEDTKTVSVNGWWVVRLKKLEAEIMRKGP